MKTEKKRIIIDTDPGTDDAIAILMALSSDELNVEALTVVPGNVTARQGLQNALGLLALAGRSDIPVAAGAQKPLMQELVTAESHGLNGMANIQLPSPSFLPSPISGPDLIIELLHTSPGEITLVPLGPLTNLAIVLSKDPSIAGLVKEVILMGGAIYGGNVDQVAEFNIYVDPEAAQIVFNAGWPLTMVGLEIGRKALFKKHHLEMLKSSKNNELNEFAVRVLEYLMARSISRGSDGISLYDPTAVAAVIDRSLIRTEFCRVEIETRGEFTRGQTVINQQNVLNRKVRKGDHFAFNGEVAVNPNVNVAVDIDTERFIKLLLERLAGNA